MQAPQTKKNVLPLVVIALVVAVLSTGIFYGLIVSRVDGSAKTAALRFVAAGRLEKGRVLGVEDFRLSVADDRGKTSPSKPEEMLGRKVLRDIEVGAVITDETLSPLLSGNAASSIPEGMRAVTLHISESSSVVQMLQSGDRVDVQSLIARNRNGETDLDLRTLLQNATVHHVVAGEATPNPQNRTVITVITTPQDAERVTVADAGSRLRVVLRNRKDQEILPLSSVSLLSVGTVSKLPVPKLPVPKLSVPKLPLPKPLVTSSFTPVPPLPKAVDLDVTLLEVSEAQFAVLVPGAAKDLLAVSSPHLELTDKLAKLPAVASSRLRVEKAGDFTWKSANAGSVRIRIEAGPLGTDGSLRLKIQPEATVAGEGGTITRRIETNVNVAARHSALVSGLLPGAKGGELLVLIAPIAAK